MIEWQILKTGTCKSYSQVPKDAFITVVNGKIVLGTCESCGKLILEGQKYVYDSDGIYQHRNCAEE